MEQGEVADKIRALGLPRANITNVTNTNGGMLDEPTVDDQRANVALSLLTPVALSMNARLVITAGNDSGQELAIAPGKSYTIGRAVDNDLVLTDIAVSRKHFDLRFENGVWLIVDRGSGNGTVVNGAIEDAPYSLANGDTIEIGNTQFRIDIPNGPARIARASMDMSDEDEPSTVASKPLREETPEPSPPVITPLGGHGLREPSRERSKTMPPPTPLRARSASQAPVPGPMSAPMQAPMHLTMPPSSQPLPASSTQPQFGALSVSTPMRGSGVGPQMAPLPPPAHGAMQQRPPMAPTMLGDAMGMPLGPGQMQGGLPASTIPGQGPPLAPSSLPPDLFGYPSSAQMPRQHAPGPNGHVIINGVAVRDATSTALVPPTPYGGMPHVMQPQYPTITRRMKLVLGGAALTLLAAIATVAIIKGGDSKQAAKSEPATEPKKTITPIEDKKPAPPPQKPEVKAEVKTEAKTEVKATPTVTANVEPKVEPKVEAKIEPPKTETKLTPTVTPKVEAKVEPKIEAKVQPKVEPKPELKTAKTVPQPKVETKPEKTKVEQPIDLKAIALGEKKTKTEPKETKPEPKKTRTKTERVSRVEPEPKPEVKEPKPKKTGFDPSGAKNKADEQYRSKQFAAASATLKSAAKNAGDEDATSLNSMAAIYQQLGAAYNVGMAPGTKAAEAFDRLRKAINLDGSAGGAFTSELKAQLAKISPKAAVAFMGAKEYVKAKQAVQSSDPGDATARDVKKALEIEAGKIYKEANGIVSSDPATAKEKLKQIRGMVDASSPWAAKAQALLNKL